MLRRSIGSSLVSLAMTAAVAPSAGAQAPPTTPSLTGEHHTGAPSRSDNCNPDGSGTLSWTVSGAATGPYTGTFREVAIAIIGSPTGTDPITRSFQLIAGFTISSTSPPAEIVGTKRSPVFMIASTNTCQSLTQALSGVLSVPYEAWVTAQGRRYSDAGSSNVFVRPTFVEDFASSKGLVLFPDTAGATGTGATPVVPSTAGAAPVLN
jgi:hypothetical protein